MNYLYSLYDALVSISVPADKARAVVDAMEREMGTTLATKQDMSQLATREDLLATKQDLRLLATKEELLAVKQEIKLLASKEELLAVKQDLGMLKRDMENRFALVEQKIDTLQLRMTVRLGSMLVVCCGLTIAAVRLWT
jgi:hypothetical protein